MQRRTEPRPQDAACVENLVKLGRTVSEICVHTQHNSVQKDSSTWRCGGTDHEQQFLEGGDGDERDEHVGGGRDEVQSADAEPVTIEPRQLCSVNSTNKQVSAVANWPARRNRALDRAWRSPMINYSGRASELGGIVNLVDRRRCSLSRSERPPFSSKVHNTSRRSICRNKFFSLWSFG